jgi:4-amino-4-deoxy-L-arabinose transferase-like glycosyltransferase
VINPLKHRATSFGIIALAIVLFAVTNLPWNLDEYDQAKQAYTSFEMVTQGHWLYQHTPNGGVATKPPLVGWLSALIFSVTRSWEFAWRFPSFLATLALLLLIGRSGAAYGPCAGLIAACAFSFNLLTPRLATLVRTDMPLALVIFLIGWFVWEKIRKQSAWNSRDRFWIFVLLSVAMLVKGPIVYAFLLPGIVAFGLWARARGEKATAWFGWWPWLASFAIFMLWVVGGVLSVPGFFEQVVMREFAGRFSGAVHKAQPFYFYLPHLLHRFAPWSILLIVLPLLAVRGTGFKIRLWLRTISPETFWLIAWSLGGLLVMSVIPSKRIDRVFPILPPLCLLVALQVSKTRMEERLRTVTEKSSAFAIIIACLYTTAYVAAKVTSAYREDTNALVKFGNSVRKEAAAHDWTLKIVGGEEEGMLLYLRQPKFIQPDDAVAEWNGGKIDGLVVSEDKLTNLRPRLPGATLSSIGASGTTGRHPRPYTLLVRSE